MFFPPIGFPGNTESVNKFYKSRELEQERFHAEPQKRQEQFLNACKNGDLKTVSKELKSSMYKEALSPNFKYNIELPLCVAARYGQKEIIDFLLGKGANINLWNGKNHTPLLEAVLHRQEPTVTLLLQRGAKVMLEAEDFKTTVLHFASFEGNLTILETLISRCTVDQLNFRDLNGKTPLHKSVEYGNVPGTKLLLSAGCDASIKDSQGLTPLDVAAQNKKLPEKTRKNLIAALLNPIQDISNELTILFRQNTVFVSKCSYSFKPIFKSILFTYASSDSGKEFLNAVISRSIKSDKIIRYTDQHRASGIRREG